MSAMRKAFQYLGFDVNDNEEYDYAEPELAPVTNLHDVADSKSAQAAPKTGPVKQVRPTRENIPAKDLRRIQTLKPRTYNDARLIGEAFRQGIPVIMNLTAMTDADAKRLVDFSAGLSFGLQGSLERVAEAVFLLSPAHVEIAIDEEPQQQDAGFYNQA